MRDTQARHRPQLVASEATPEPSLHRSPEHVPTALHLMPTNQSDRRHAASQAIKQTNVEAVLSLPVIHPFKCPDCAHIIRATFERVEVPGPAVVITVRSDVAPIRNQG